mgnify:CR=1 FL=1
MIRRIPQQETLSPKVAEYCNQLSNYQYQDKLFSGDIDITYATRVATSTDNSIYQALPQAVLFPKSTDDLVVLCQLANETEFSSIRFSPRGGGTGTNGQSLTEHVVIDMSRHMREILEINVEERWVRVQSGVIKDQLNDYLRPFGFFFAPDLSTSNRATIGGMINTDASGQGSLVYGKTSDHVLGLKAVTIAGDVLNTAKQPIKSASEIASGDSALAKIYDQVINTCRDHRAEILDVFPRLNRFLTGYDLEHTFNDTLTEFDLSRVLTGSEGTLAFISEAKLNVTPIAKYKTLVNVKYDSFDSALRNSPFLVEANATSVETVDSKVLNLAKQDVVWDTVSDLIQAVPGIEMDGLNIVEFNDESEQSQSAKVENLCARLDELIENKQAGVIGYQVTTDLVAISKIYGMRKKAVGLLGNAKSSKKPIAFAEDTAVPPENLADFIAEFKHLLDGHGLDYGMFGHVDAGVLHVRPALDLSDPEQEKLMRRISDEVVKLTAKYGGLMWGEHGKGYRSEYGPAFFGDKLFAEVRKIKSAFDPNNRLNPGKICTPYQSQESLVSVDGAKRAHKDKQIPIEVKTEFETTTNCNGNGLCFNYDVNSPMCPSYKASNDRRYSPKGRASLMREWLRLQGDMMAPEAQAMSRVTIMKAMDWPFKLIRSVAAKMGTYDFSHEVKDSMDECLACKACTTACPIKVDVPTFRTKFLDAYYTRYMRPISDYLVANVESLLPIASKAPRLANLAAFNPLSNWVTRNAFGYMDAPKFSPKLSKLIAADDWFEAALFEALSPEDKKRAVFIVQDPFTSAYESELVSDTVTLLKHLGYLPKVLPYHANGKPAHVKGFMAKFTKIAKKSTAYFNDIAKLNVTMVGLDASLVFAYRDEYVKALGQDKVRFKVQVLSDWLSQQNFDTGLNKEGHQVNLFAHCTEKSLMAGVEKQWVTIYQKLGLELTPVSTGCCGMAGTFGHEKKHQQTSKKLFDLSWQPALEKHGLENTVATGFSCRCQVKRFGQGKVKHPVSQIVELLK